MTAKSDRPRVGVDIGGTKLLLAALHRDGLELHRVPTGPGTGPGLIEREIRSFLFRFDDPPAALGITVPGLVDVDGRVTACGTFPSLEGWQAEDAFADPGCPVRVLNDAEAALVEETHDVAPDATAAIVMAGTWIGAAFRANGAPIWGARGWAGELGYAPIALQDGRVARLDDLAGGGAIARGLDTDGAALHERAMRGDPNALTAIRRAGEALGLGLATLVNLLNPELLVLGGGAFELPGYRKAALENAERYSLPGHWQACTVRSTRAGEAVAALGAIRAAQASV